jgi:hypothetical protein
VSGRVLTLGYRPARGASMTYDPYRQPPYGHPQDQPPVVSGPPQQYPPTQPWPIQQPGPAWGAPPAEPQLSYPPSPYEPPPAYGAPPYVAPPPGYLMPAAKQTSPLKAVLITVGAVVLVCLGAIVAIGVAGGDDTGGGKPTAGGAVASAAVAEPTRAAEEPAAEQPADSGKAFDVPMGSTITATGDDGEVIEATLRSVKTFKKGCGSFGPDPDNGLYVVVDLVVTQKKGTGSVNPLHFEFVSADGTAANALSGAFSGCEDPSLSSADLRAGQKRAGKIAFDATKKAGSLEWTPGGLFGEPVGSWKVK